MLEDIDGKGNFAGYRSDGRLGHLVCLFTLQIPAMDQKLRVVLA